MNLVMFSKSFSDQLTVLIPTGELTQGELYSAIKKEKEQTEAGDAGTTHFSGEMHFYELVEDTKDGIWLVQVKPHNSSLLKSVVGWKVDMATILLLLSQQENPFCILSNTIIQFPTGNYYLQKDWWHRWSQHCIYADRRFHFSNPVHPWNICL